MIAIFGQSGVALYLILEALGYPLVPFWLSGVALNLMLEALGDILGIAWSPGWPGDARKGWIALTLEREPCFTRIQGSRGQPKWVVI